MIWACAPAVFLASCIDWGDPTQADGESDGVLPDGLDGTESDCPAGQAWCDGACIDVQSNHAHCGGCNNACEPYEVCSAGNCSLECPDGLIACSGGCVDLSSDTENCGTCGKVCTAGENATAYCDEGVCAVRCEQGWSDLDGDGSCETECVPTSDSEICNGVDDDCDGDVDEDFDCRMGQPVACDTTCGSTGTGTCGLDCRPPPPDLCDPPAELCNGLDDDCDGACDNGFECCGSDSEFCTSSCGSTGMRECTATCMWSSCIPPPETCNGADDDCDGACDNGFECCRNGSGTCTTSCGSAGTRACSDTCAWQACIPPPETCNGRDDDCDGTCDNGFGCCASTSQNCPTSCGSTGTIACSSSCSWGLCTPPAETCNDRDDDCDGDTDEDFRQYRCPLTGSTVPSQDTCNDGCAVTQACSVSTTNPTASGSATTSNECGLRIRGSGASIIVEQYDTYWDGGCTSSLVTRGTITLSGVTTQTCPLGSFPCTGSPPACTQTASCQPVIVCP
jgi:hypothetical protein